MAGEGKLPDGWVWSESLGRPTRAPINLKPGYQESLVIPGDPHWHAAHRELRDLHIRKSSTYGNTADPLANFTVLAGVAGQAAERYALERIVEKCVRALHMIDAGKAEQVKEYPDIASLGLCAEALRRRR